METSSLRILKIMPRNLNEIKFYSTWGKWRGVKGMKRFSVHFNVHTPIQIGFVNNFENCRSPFKNKTLHQESSQESCDVQNFDNQVKTVVGAHMKEYRNKWQTTAGESQLG
jgi:hypothetical protein